MLQDVLGSSNFSIEREVGSTFTNIYFVTCNGVRYVVKRVKSGVFQELGPEKANALTNHFQTKLRELGVPLPKVYRTFVFSGEVWHLSSDEGQDVQVQLAGNQDLVNSKIEQVLQAVLGVLTQVKPEVGLDPRISNFAGNGAMPVYIDIFPPLCFFEGKCYVHLPNPVDPEKLESEFQRKFTPEGIVSRLRFEFLTASSSSATVVRKHVESMLPEPFRTSVLAHLDAMPDNLIGQVSKPQLEQVIDSFASHQTEQMRSFGARLMSSDVADRAKYMREIFVLTSSYATPGYPESQQDRLAMYKELMKQQLVDY